MTKVYLVRHGETEWNKLFKYQGHTDVALTKLGYEQAAKVGKRLSKENVQVVYTSDLGRAFETAKAIACHHNLMPIVKPAFKEINFGVWEGLTYSQINESYSEAMAKWYTHPCDVVIPDAETFEQVKQRAFAELKNVVKELGEGTAVIVSHGGTIRTLLCAVLGLDLNSVWRIKQDNTAVNLMEFHQGRAMISLLNDTHHLEHY